MINTLTSLRIFFALMVFGAHCYVIDSVFDAHFFKEGFVGVSFFFVLSGFIIAYNYQVFFLCAADIPKVYRYSCYYWLPVALVILIFSLQKGGISRLLSNRLFIIGGEISYSFYLLHSASCKFSSANGGCPNTNKDHWKPYGINGPG